MHNVVWFMTYGSSNKSSMRTTLPNRFQTFHWITGAEIWLTGLTRNLIIETRSREAFYEPLLIFAPSGRVKWIHWSADGHIPLSYSNPTCYALPMHLEATRNTRSNSHNFNPPYFFHRSLRNIFDAGFLFFYMRPLADKVTLFILRWKRILISFTRVFFNSTLASNLFAFIPNLIKPCTVAKLFA